MENSTNFSEKDAGQVNDLLGFVLDNKYSDFYRKKYAGLNIGSVSSYEDFARIPLLTKDEILGAPIDQRIFVAPDEVKRYSFSSATTRHNRPTIIPHGLAPYNIMAAKDFFTEEKMRELKVKRIMVLWPIMSSPFYRYITDPQKHTLVVMGYVNNLKLSADAAKQIKIQGLTTTATILDYFIDALEQVSFDLGSIRWVALGGEFCSAQKFAYFQSKLPNALFVFRYANSEVGTIGYRCEKMNASEPPNIYHVSRVIHIVEITDAGGKIVPLGEAGEIIVTSLGKKPFSPIRYRIGDTGYMEKRECSCGNDLRLVFGGRMNFDVLKVYGVVIHAQAIEQSLSTLSGYLDKKYQMHVFEERTEGRLRPKMVLHLKLREVYAKNKKDPYFYEIVKETVSKNLYLSSKNSLKQLVEQKIFLPLEIVFEDEWPKDGYKSKNIISHL
jgi:phenylacetate-CoA ligase